MSEEKKIDGEWVRCKYCGHKLFKRLPFDSKNEHKGAVKVEIKCHSCKRISEFTLDN